MKTFGVDRALRLAVLLLTLALVAVVASTLRDHNVVAGDSAPSFEITTDSGRKVSVDSFGGRVIVGEYRT